MINTIFFVLLTIAIVCGYWIGFLKQLKLMIKGIVGVIISLYFSWVVLNSFENTFLFSSIIENLNLFFSNRIQFLQFFNVGKILVFCILFIISRIICAIIARFIQCFEEVSSKTFIIINKTLGTMLSVSMYILLILLIFALATKLSSVFGFSLIDLENLIKQSILYKIYINNPVSF